MEGGESPNLCGHNAIIDGRVMVRVKCGFVRYLAKPVMVIAAVFLIVGACNNVFADSWQTSPNTTVPQNTSHLVTFTQPYTQLPSNAILSNVQLQYQYIAYGGYQNYLTARINKGADPETTGGVSLGNPSASTTTGSTPAYENS
jgi:hypothetical protein